MGWYIDRWVTAGDYNAKQNSHVTWAQKNLSQLSNNNNKNNNEYLNCRNIIADFNLNIEIKHLSPPPFEHVHFIHDVFEPKVSLCIEGDFILWYIHIYIYLVM